MWKLEGSYYTWILDKRSMVLGFSTTEIVGSSPPQGIDVCPRFSVLSYDDEDTEMV